MPIRVAHVNVARGFRGGERQTELLARGLDASAVSQVLVARRGGALAGRLRDAPVEIRAVSGSVWSVARATADAQLIHVHEGRSVYGAYLRWLLSRTPYVLTRRVNNPIRDHWFAHQAYRNAARVVAVAPAVADVVRRYDPGVRVEVIHSSSSGLRADEGQAAALRAEFPDKLVVGHVGALDNAQKGQEYIIAAARQLASTHPDIQFVLVGGGEDEVMLKSLAAGLPNVAFTGFVENVGDHLAAFDVFILPSNREGIGSILFDAMDRSLPVVASRVGGVADIVRDGENGILIDAGSVPQLVSGILRLREDPALRARLGARGREIAREFTADAMARKYLRLYRAVLSQDS
jgi:glycosyltransferase involved in cell wall biosynthesis